MTRKSRREIESAVEDMDSEQSRGPSEVRFVYRDPKTGKLYDGRGPTPDPVEELPETVTPIVWDRTVSMMREEADRKGREIVKVVDEHRGGEVVAARRPLAKSVDTDAAVQLPESELGEPLADFTEMDT